MPRHRRVPASTVEFPFLNRPLFNLANDHPLHPLTTQPSYLSTYITMVLGRLTHWALDALAISTVLAGVKKQTGFA